MSDGLTFWLGMRAAGKASAFCICGDALDGSRRFAVHVADGSGTHRQVCDACALKYAPTLASVAQIRPRPVTMSDLLIGPDHPVWQLVPREPIVEMDTREIVEMDEIVDPDAVAECAVADTVLAES